jgi:hypothetical protein
MHKQFGNWKHALMAYNGGPGAVSDYLRAGNWSGNDKGVRPKENIDYVNSIMGSSAGLTPEQRQKAAATYQEVRLDNYQKHYGDLVTQGNYLSALEDLQKRREAGEISAEDYAKIVMGVNLIDNAITNRENKEYNTRVSAGINEFSTRLNSGRLDPVEFRNNNNIPGGIKNGLLTMCDDTAERNRNKGSREYQAIYMAVDNAIQTGRIKSSLELYNFAGVKENLSWDSFSSLLKNMNTLEGKGTEDYVHLAWKGFKNTGNKEYEILFRSVMSRTLASYGLTVRDPEARELAARLLEYDPKARLYNFQKDPSVSMQALRMGQILANKRQPALDDYENILTYLGKDDTESNHLRLDAAITAMRMSNDSLSLDEAWKLSSPYNDFPGGGKPTLNCGWMVNRYDQDIDEWGNAFGYDPNLIKSAIAVISGGDPYFTAPNGIQGVLPLRLSNQEETRRTKELLIQGRFDPGVFLLPGGPGDVLLRDDPRTNIKAVSQYIGALFASGLTNEQVYRDIFSLMGYGGKELEAKIDQTLTLYRQGGRKWSEKSLIGDNSPQETLEREKTQWQSSPFSGLFPLGER